MAKTILMKRVDHASRSFRKVEPPVENEHEGTDDCPDDTRQFAAPTNDTRSTMPSYGELSKRASDLIVDPNADPDEVDLAFRKMLEAAPGAERRAQVAKLRNRIAKQMDELAVIRKRDGETRLDSYCRLLEEDDFMGRMYCLYEDAGRLLD